MELPFGLGTFLALGVDFQLSLDRALVAAVSLVKHVAGIRGQISVPLKVLDVENVGALGQSWAERLTPKYFHQWTCCCTRVTSHQIDRLGPVLRSQKPPHDPPGQAN